MSKFYSPEYKSAVDKLERYGMARNRVEDREIRQVILTDDEALAVLDVLTQQES
jgi:hypothetical protein